MNFIFWSEYYSLYATELHTYWIGSKTISDQYSNTNVTFIARIDLLLTPSLQEEMGKYENSLNLFTKGHLCLVGWIPRGTIRGKAGSGQSKIALLLVLLWVTDCELRKKAYSLNSLGLYICTFACMFYTQKAYR